MFDSLFVTSTDDFGQKTVVNSFDEKTVIICISVALLLGILISIAYMYATPTYTKNFAATLALLPIIVQAVLVMVNGNVGTSVAVLGIFSLVRFRSVPGSSKEITAVFLTTAIGLAIGMGFIGYAVVLTVIVGIAFVLFAKIPLKEKVSDEKLLRITIAENLDYTEIFDDIFAKYLKTVTRQRVKTVNMGTMYDLQYIIVMKDVKDEKKMLDEIRCRNGNLTVACGKVPVNTETL
ncbi:MAG: DUF4956 domain-containing protein [Lachnospiraceae bacterium]|nr:DUF4956 domain-containing protein [Lachnospiraceae bacterium]